MANPTVQLFPGQYTSVPRRKDSIVSANTSSNPSLLRRASPPSDQRAGQRLRHDGLRFRNDLVQMSLAAEALRVQLVNVLGARRAGGEPSSAARHFESTDGRIVARSVG